MKKRIWHIVGLISIAIGLPSNGLAGDSSPRWYFAGTGSYYQEFIGEALDPEDAQIACQEKGGHLVTITSKAENDFLNKQAQQHGKRFWIGGNDVTLEGEYAWITGEPWNFTAWKRGEPNNSNNPITDDYILFEASSSSLGGQWDSTSGGSSFGTQYMCEWERDYALNSVSIGDLTGDKIAEIGVYTLVKGKRTVNLVNPITNKKVSTLTFGTLTTIENNFIAPVSDMNGNGKPEVAIVIKKTSPSTVGFSNIVYIKDTSNNAATLKSFSVSNNSVDLLSMQSIADLNGDRVSELQFLTKSITTGAGKILIFNPKTGKLLKTITPP